MILPLRGVPTRIPCNGDRAFPALTRLIWLGLGGWTVAANLGALAASPHLWQPAPDAVYLQETGRKVPSAEPLKAVAVFEGKAYAGSEKGLARLDGEKLEPVPEMREPVRRLVAAGEALWVMTGHGLHRLQAGTWMKISAEPVTDVTEHLGKVIASSGARLFRIHGDKLEPLSTAECPFGIARVISHGETLYAQGGDHLTFLDGQRFGGFDVYGFPAEQGWDWGSLPSPNVRDAVSLGSALYLATDRGLGVWRGMSLTALRGEQGLCYEDTTCLGRGFTNDLWIGTTRGAIRMADGHFDYFAGQRWLPDDRVRAMAAGERAVYLATDKGLGIIEFEPFTLRKKAAFYERHLVEWGQKRLGFIHKLEWDDGLRQYVREISDNDGGYSGDYLAAESYRYAVTKDPQARLEAVNTFHALRWLEAMTSLPGFPARAVWVKGSHDHKSMSGSGGLPAEWHDTADGRFEWKGDTSSDELCSHFYATTLFLELAAQGDEKVEAKEHLARIATHLLEHHWQLIDLDGKPTRWGRWDPEYFTTDEGRVDRGLQALEILSFMKTAATLAGDPKFTAAYGQLVEMGYPEYTVRQRNTPPPPENIAHFEDQLALWSCWNLLRFEKDAPLRSIYRRSLERTYEVVRIERNPWYNFVYGALTGNNCEVEEAVNHLRGWPLDLVVWSYQNSQRSDLRTPPGYVALNGGVRTFLPRETEPLRWDHWLMQADGGTGGRDVADPSGWLLAYWMGRYYGFIEGPKVTDARLLTVERNRGKTFGAKPYEGPKRPVGF
jgi:hypothetical protein